MTEEFDTSFGSILSEEQTVSLRKQLYGTLNETFNATSTMDAPERMQKVAASSTILLVDFFTSSELDRKSTRLNSSHSGESRMPSSA